LARREPKVELTAPPTVKSTLIKRLRELGVVLLLPVAVYLALVFLTHHASDPGFSHAGSGPARNLGGSFGAWFSDFIYALLGAPGALIATVPLLIGWRLWRGNTDPDTPLAAELLTRVLGFAFTLISAATLAQLHFSPQSGLPNDAGGLLGTALAGGLIGFGFTGVTLFALALFFLGFTLYLGFSWLKLMDWLGAQTISGFERLKRAIVGVDEWRVQQRARNEREVVRKIKQKAKEPLKIEPALPKLEKSERVEKREAQMPLFDSIPSGPTPPLTLLDEPKVQPKGYSPEALEALSRQVELKLKDFRIEATVVGVYPGPVITRFELEPAPGIKGSTISNLDKDIARGLSVPSVRVVEVIPGKSVIGLEIPNASRETIYLSEMLGSDKYDKAASPLTLALGKDIGGRPVVVDVGKMPHLLVAGTTGSGKSVAVNAMVLSLLFKAPPNDVRLIMIDPKMLELSVYEGIPHLLAPVVTDMKEAANALRWCVGEMDRRYKLMSRLAVRNLAGFNRKVKDAEAAGQPIENPLKKAQDPNEGFAAPDDLTTLPSIVVIIDEFADMMMIVGKKVEELIARLAQKARAAGIHLILATQRPSVDVITGLIKANIPVRIAFQVSSKIDSRTILDQSGAEGLLGHGDMLYLPPGTGNPERVHGAFVSDEEVHRVVEYLKQHAGPPDYIDEILNEVQVLDNGQIINASGLPEDAAANDPESDELYDSAVRFVTESRKASISVVQRHLRVGYNRAARMIEQMEATGIVSPPAHNGNREVLVNRPPSL
jgi:DNA segregation ATPase FtsK/SpoIIIE, S-DNA-T family